jgi:archaeosine-15-forming tRNA-guanine transglycosylase
VAAADSAISADAALTAPDEPVVTNTEAAMVALGASSAASTSSAYVMKGTALVRHLANML